jgi:hypothetical protein
MIKRVSLIALFTATILLSLLITLYSVFRSTAVQTFCARLAAHYLSNVWQTEVLIHQFDFSISHGLVIKDISIRDQHHEILFSADRLGLKINIPWSTGGTIKIRRAFVDKGQIQLLTYKGDSTLNLQFILDYFTPAETTILPDTVPSPPFRLMFSSVELVDTRFHFQNMNDPPVPWGMDYSNIDVSDINLDITNIEIDQDTIRAHIGKLSAREQSGFTLHGLSGDFQVSPAFLKAHDLKIITPNSNLDLSFDFLYTDWNAYVDFLNKVTIRAQIQPSIFDMTDITYFAPDIRQMQNRFHFSGNIRGTVSNFKAHDFTCSFGQQTSFNGDIRANGLPDVYKTYVDMKLNSFTTIKADLETFLIPGETDHLMIPSWIDQVGILTLSGTYTGFYDEFITSIHASTHIGSISTDLAVIRDKETGTIGYQGRLDGTSLDLGTLLGTPNILGCAGFRSGIDGKGLTLKDASLKVHMQVDSIDFNHYRYRNISMNGVLSDRFFEGKATVRDYNLNMDFFGLIDLKDSVPKFDFKSKIKKADLFALHLLERDSLNRVSSVINVNFTGSSIDDIDGIIRIDSTLYREGNHTITMDHLSLKTDQDASNKDKSYQLTSDFADARISGDFRFSNLVPSLYLFINEYLESFRSRDTIMIKLPDSSQVMNYAVHLKETGEVTDLFLPFMKIAPGTVLMGEYNEKKRILTMHGTSPAISCYGIDMTGWYLHTQTKQDNLNIETGCDYVYLKRKNKTDSVEVTMDSFRLTSDIFNDTVRYQISWTNDNIPSHLGGSIDFRNYPEIVMKMNDFDLVLNNRHWALDPDNFILIDTTYLFLRKFNLTTEQQYLYLHGAISGNVTDTLTADFNRVDVSRLDALLGGFIDLDGILSGKVKLTNLYHGFTILSDLYIEDFSFNRELLGDATFLVQYSEKESRFDVRSEILYTGNIGTNIPFSLNGSMLTDSPQPRFDFTLLLKNLNLRMLNPFVASFMSGLNGLVSGQVFIKGTPTQPIVTGEINLKRTEFRINYLNVGYSLADVITLDPGAFLFNNITLYDSLGHKAYLNGKMSHDHFQDFRLDLNINLDDFSAFNNTRYQNNIFYGKARGSGTVTVKGPFNELMIDARVKTGGNTHVTIPINLTESVDDNYFIAFEHQVSDTIKVISRKVEEDNFKLSLNLAIMVNPDAVVEVFFPNQLGNLSASGKGTITLNMTPASPFSMKGIYTLDDGSFVFTLRNLLRLPMAIKEGSSITWMGDPADANVNIAASYRTKAPLEGLTTDPQIAGIRCNVECILRLSGKLMNPDIGFGLNLPNVEESIRNLVYSAIDTNNASEMNQQMIYLMVANQFKPVVSGSNTSINVGSTSVSLLTNQINSWLSGISKNVNVGVNYRPPSGTTQQEFDVSFSTQFLDDRLLIDGTFGMNSYSNTNLQQASTVVGDINIQYILTKNRRWRVHAFNRTNTLSILNNNSPYTQGVGITYTRDFSNFRDLFTGSMNKK